MSSDMSRHAKAQPVEAPRCNFRSRNRVIIVQSIGFPHDWLLTFLAKLMTAFFEGESQGSTNGKGTKLGVSLLEAYSVGEPASF